MYNYFMLIGRLTKDPEVIKLEDGRQVMNISLAVKKPFKNSNGEYETDFFKVSCWEFLVENFKDYLKKGQPIAVKGRLNVSVVSTESGYDKEIPVLIGEKIMLFNSTKKTNPTFSEE